MLTRRGMRRHALLPALPLLLATACCYCPGSGGSGGPASPPACDPGRPCTDDHGRIETCTDYGSCPDLCPVGEAKCCVSNLDCSQAGHPGYQAVCDRASATCVLACVRPGDCETLAHVAGDCRGGGCVCDEGVCRTPPCSADADCAPGKRCVAGTCGDGIAATDCTVLPGPVVVAPGARRPLTALTSEGGRFGPPAIPPSWSSSAPSVASVDPASGRVEGGPDAGIAEITATTGGTACGIAVRNLGPAPATVLRVVALDPATHALLPGLSVVVRRPGTPPITEVTGSDGLADLAGVPPGPVEVDVLDLSGPATGAPNGRTWVSLVGVTARTLLVPVPANPVPGTAGGIRGALGLSAFEALSDRSAHLGLVGLSWPGGLAGLDLVRLSGPYVQVDLTDTILGVRIGLPSGLVLGVGSRIANADFAAVGVRGRRVRFALFGNTYLDEAMSNLSGFVGLGAGTASAGAMASGVLPDFDQYGMTDSATPLTAVVPLPFAGGLPDFAHFLPTTVAAGPRLRHAVRIDVPRLPAAPAGASAPWLGGMMAVPGVFLDGEGFTPLGMGFAVDVRQPGGTERPDGRLDDAQGNPATTLVVRFAPPNGGLEGQPPYLLLLAGNPDSLAGDPSAEPARSARLVPLADLPFDDTVDATGPMLPVPTWASWDPASRTARATFPARATLHRFTFTDRLGHRWEVLAPAGADSVTLPDASPLCATPGCIDPAAGSVEVRVAALALDGGLDYQGLVRLDGTDLDRLPRLTAEASRAEASRR